MTYHSSFTARLQNENTLCAINLLSFLLLPETDNYSIVTFRRIVYRTGEESVGYFRMNQICDTCANYAYDEEYEEYVCQMNMDEDEWYRFVTDHRRGCPYYRNGDEYAVVRHQM